MSRPISPAVFPARLYASAQKDIGFADLIRYRCPSPRNIRYFVIHIITAEKINGEWVQKLTIYYNCVGALFIPDTPSMPVPDVTVNTRRGVYVSYEPAQNGQ